MWLWVRGLGLSVSFLLCGVGFNLLGGPPLLLPGAWWPRVWHARPVCSMLVRRPPGFFGGLFRLVLQVRVSPAVLCPSVPRGVASCSGALHCGALWCGVPWSLVVPWWVSEGQPGLCRGAECRPECGCLVARGCG